MSPVLAAFPRRPMVLKAGRGALGNWLLALVGVLLFGGFLVMLAVAVVPAIRDDFAVRAEARPAPGVARVVTGSCRSRLFLLQSCEITLSWRGAGTSGTRKVTYIFVEPHMGSWNAVAMVDPKRPELVTTDIGLDRLWNRTATAVGGGIVTLLLIGGIVIGVRRSQSDRGQVKALSGRPLEPVAVRFHGWIDNVGWMVEDEHGATFKWPARKSDRPFLLDEARGLVLALRDPAGGPAFPLDEKLSFVVLTPQERDRILAAGQGAVRR